MDSQHSTNTDFNKYDSGLIKHDVEFDSQNLLDSNRKSLLKDQYDMSHLKKYIIQFKNLKRINKIEEKNDNESSNNYGKLQFDCDFESGNIGDITHYKNDEYDMTIRGDTNNSRHCIWFYFRVRGGIAGNKFTCNITNYSKAKCLYSEGFTPLVRSKTKPIWTRLPSTHVNWFKSNRHKKSGNCATFSFIFDRTGDEYFFAYSFVYTYSYLQKFLSDIEKLNLPFLQRQLLARTVQQRRLDCLRIEEIDKNNDNDATNKPKSAFDDRPVIVISSRVHPGETPSSYIVHGMIEFLISDHEAAVFLRKNLTIFVIPMLNPDGVFIGNYRCTSLGYDLNRHWQHPDFSKQPTICALKYLLRQLDAQNKLDFYIDLHGHTNATDAFMYCNQSQPTQQQIRRVQSHLEHKEGNDDDEDMDLLTHEPPANVLKHMHNKNEMKQHYQRNDFTTIFPRLLALHCNEYSFSKTKFCNNPKKAGSARRAMEAILSDIPVCYTFEVSFWKSGHLKNSAVHGKEKMKGYTQETYRNLGRCMCLSLCEMYKLPKDKRMNLNEYNFKAKKFMKGDLRKRVQKLNRLQNKSKNGSNGNNETKNKDESDKINPSISGVSTT